jgi:hypothetical protein
MNVQVCGVNEDKLRCGFFSGKHACLDMKNENYQQCI